MLATAGAKIQFVLSYSVADWQDYVCTAGARGVACGLWGTPGQDVLMQVCFTWSKTRLLTEAFWGCYL